MNPLGQSLGLSPTAARADQDTQEANECRNELVQPVVILNVQKGQVHLPAHSSPGP